MKRLAAFFRRETVLCLSFLIALVSAIFVPPDARYLGYVDWNVILLLLSLMIVVAGLKAAGVFDAATRAVTSRVKDARLLTLLLSLCCFFFAMIVTNDVALIAFVPLTVTLLSGLPGALIFAVSLEAVAANLGSMLTPIGNPQNLYLYSHYHLTLPQLMGAVAPLAGVSLVLVCLMCLLVKKERVAPNAPEECAALRTKPLMLYGALLVICLLTVMRLVPHIACCAAVVLATLLCDRRLFTKVDYALLGTFICFFVFVGNLTRLDAVGDMLRSLMAGRELELGVLCTQVVSNVPAALMLSGFTDNAIPLLRGVNIGGLGTLVGSLASLIAFKLYCKAEGASPRRYLLAFTLMNIAFLVPLYFLAKALGGA